MCICGMTSTDSEEEPKVSTIQSINVPHSMPFYCAQSTKHKHDVSYYYEEFDNYICNVFLQINWLKNTFLKNIFFK